MICSVGSHLDFEESDTGSTEWMGTETKDLGVVLLKIGQEHRV